MTKPTTITNGEKILATQIIWVVVCIVLTVMLFSIKRSLNVTDKLVLQHQETIELCQKNINTAENDIRELGYKKYVTPEKLEKVRQWLAESRWDLHEQFTDFVYKAESRLPILKRI